MVWCRSRDKPLSEPITVSLLTHICVTRPPWANQFRHWWRYMTSQNLVIIGSGIRDRPITGTNVDFFVINNIKNKIHWNMNHTTNILLEKMRLKMSSVIWRSFYSSSYHYNDMIMSAMASQITAISIICSTVCSCADQRKHQSSALLAFVRKIERWPVDSPHEDPVTRPFSFDDVIMEYVVGVRISTARTFWVHIWQWTTVVIFVDTGAITRDAGSAVWRAAGVLSVKTAARRGRNAAHAI